MRDGCHRESGKNDAAAGTAPARRAGVVASARYARARDRTRRRWSDRRHERFRSPRRAV